MRPCCWHPFPAPVNPDHSDQALAEYRQRRDGFRLECPEFFNFGTDVIDRRASERPAACALFWAGATGQRHISFGAFAGRTDRIANGLEAMGLRRGDRVLLVLPALVEWWESMVGLMKAGIIAIPATPLLTSKDIAYRVQSAGVDAVITDADGAAKVDAVAASLTGLRFKIAVCENRREIPGGWDSFEEALGGAPALREPTRTRSDEAALIYFTSGTTGLPKMVLHTHASYGIGHRLTGEFWLGLHPGDLHWNISDTGWAKTAYAALFGPWIAGSGIFVRHKPGKFDAADVLRQLGEHPISSVCGAPTIYRMLLQQDLAGFRPKALRQCMAAGEPLNPVVFERWQAATGFSIREGYGQTETVVLCCCPPEVGIRPGSMGLPPPGIDLAVLGADGEPLPPGEVGEIAVKMTPQRPVGLFQEYWKNAAATAEVFRDGWYHTGDCASTDADGFFWFVARADDVITSSAYRIGPFEVENALMQHPAVAEVAVVGKPDPVRTEIVKAFIVLADGHAPSDALKRELQEHTRRTTAPYKYPREIEFLDELPKTVSGKVRRVELRARG